MNRADRWKFLLASITDCLAQPIGYAILGSMILMSFYAVNGYAILFSDSLSYVHGPALAVKVMTGHNLAPDWRPYGPGTIPGAVAKEAPIKPPVDHGYTANRSIFYGVLPFLGYVTGGFLLTVGIQAICVAYPISILILRILKLKPIFYFALMALLTCLTALGPIVDFMMPDVFAPVMIMSFSLLFAYWKHLARHEIILLSGLMGFSALCHASHVVILILLATTVGVIPLLFRQAPKNRNAVTIAFCAALVGLSGELAFEQALQKVTGEKPLVLPHIVAHLIDMGPGYRYIVSRCPDPDLVICKYEDRLPQNWNDFLFSHHKNGVFAIAPMADKRKISDGQLRFALAVLRYDPVGVTVGMSEDALKQFGMFSLRNLQIRGGGMPDYRLNWPETVSRHIENSAVGRGPILLNAISLSGYLLAIGGASALVAMGASDRGAGRIRRTAPGFHAASEVLLLGVFWNAIVCGVIASPYDRFQARVIWLIPMLALIAGALWLRDKTTAEI